MSAATPLASPAPLRALVVDDAPEVHQILVPVLTREGFEVRTASDGAECLELARSFDPDVIVLDLIIPAVDGIEVCRRIRTFSDAYVVMVTSKGAEVDRVVGLSVGADDYLAKPFSPVELVARVRAMLRRPRRMATAATPGNGSDVVEVGPILVDRAAREVLLDGRVVELTRIEFDLLDTLCSRPRMVFSRAQLLELVWGPNWFGDTHVVDVHVSNLRAKLGERHRATRLIQTVRGVGFRLSDDVAAAAAS